MTPDGDKTSKFTIHEVTEAVARQMLDRAQVTKANAYPTPDRGYAVSVLTDRAISTRVFPTFPTL